MTMLAAVLLLLAAGAAAPQESTLVGGRVLDDRDAPVAGATVYLIGGPAPGARPVITSEEGRYAWSGVAPATYTIAIAKAGYPTVRYGQTRADGPGTAIEIHKGQRLVLDLRLPRGAVISGTVVDESGEPLAGRQILLFRPSGAGVAAPSLRDRPYSSNARGQYRLFGLAAGTYRLGVALAGSSDSAISESQGSVSVTVAAGEEREGVDLRTAALARTTNVTVRPVSASLQPLRLPQVSLWRRGATRATFTYGTRNPDGSSTFADVPAGEYEVAVRAGNAWGRGEVTVDGEHPASLLVTMTPGVRVAGQVVFDGSASPPARVTLHLVSTDPGSLSEGSGLLGQMAANGSFTIPGVPPGRFLIRSLGVSGVDPWTLQSAKAASLDAADLPLTVGSEDITGIVVTMTDARSALAGTVTSAAGTPANGVDIVVYPSDPRYRTRNSRRVASARTTVDGAYEVKDLPPGDYAIAVVDEVDREALQDPAVLEHLRAVAAVTLARGETHVQNVVVR